MMNRYKGKAGGIPGDFFSSPRDLARFRWGHGYRKERRHERFTTATEKHTWWVTTPSVRDRVVQRSGYASGRDVPFSRYLSPIPFLDNASHPKWLTRLASLTCTWSGQSVWCVFCLRALRTASHHVPNSLCDSCKESQRANGWLDPNHVGNLRSLLNYMGSKSYALRRLMDVMWEPISSRPSSHHPGQREEPSYSIIDEDEYNSFLPCFVRSLPWNY